MKKTILAMSLLCASLPALGMQGVKRIGSFKQLFNSYTDFYSRNPYVPIAQGTFLKSTNGTSVDADLQSKLIQEGIEIAKEQGRPVIFDAATVYNQFYQAGDGFKKAFSAADNTPVFIVIKFNETDFTSQKIKMGKFSFKKEDIEIEHFRNRYQKTLDDMGVDAFTVVMPHGNFFVDYGDFLWALDAIGVDRNRTAVGASNFLRKSSLDAAKQASENTGWIFGAVEFEKHIRCSFNQVNAFLSENQSVFSFYVGVFGGKAKTPAYELIPEGVEIGASVPELCEQMLAEEDFSAFSSPMEIAVNAAIRNHSMPIAILSTTNSERLVQNYTLNRRTLSKEVKDAFDHLELLGPSVRYDKGVREEDKVIYNLHS